MSANIGALFNEFGTVGGLGIGMGAGPVATKYGWKNSLKHSGFETIYPTTGLDGLPVYLLAGHSDPLVPGK